MSITNEKYTLKLKEILSIYQGIENSPKDLPSDLSLKFGMISYYLEPISNTFSKLQRKVFKKYAPEENKDTITSKEIQKQILEELNPALEEEVIIQLPSLYLSDFDKPNVDGFDFQFVKQLMPIIKT